MMLLFDKMGMNVSYGAITAALIGYFLSTFVSLCLLNKKYNFSFKDTVKKMPRYILGWFVFVIVMFLLKLFVPVNMNGRLIQIPILIIYGVVSFGIYIYISYKSKIIKEVLGNSINDKLKRIFK